MGNSDGCNFLPIFPARGNPPASKYSQMQAETAAQKRRSTRDHLPDLQDAPCNHSLEQSCSSVAGLRARHLSEEPLAMRIQRLDSSKHETPDQFLKRSSESEMHETESLLGRGR